MTSLSCDDLPNFDAVFHVYSYDYSQCLDSDGTLNIEKLIDLLTDYSLERLAVMQFIVCKYYAKVINQNKELVETISSMMTFITTAYTQKTQCMRLVAIRQDVYNTSKIMVNSANPVGFISPTWYNSKVCYRLYPKNAEIQHDDIPLVITTGAHVIHPFKSKRNRRHKKRYNRSNQDARPESPGLKINSRVF